MDIKNNVARSVVVLWGVTVLPKPQFLMSFDTLQAIRDRHAGLADVSPGTSIPFCLTGTFQSKNVLS